MHTLRPAHSRPHSRADDTASASTSYAGPPDVIQRSRVSTRPFSRHAPRRPAAADCTSLRASKPPLQSFAQQPLIPKPGPRRQPPSAISQSFASTATRPAPQTQRGAPEYAAQGRPSPESLRRLLAPLLSSLALALAPALAPGNTLVSPAAARIPTETVLSDNGGGGGGGGGGAGGSRASALMQLAAPPSAVLVPPEPGPASETGRAAAGAATRSGPAPGTMVGTPNYARRSAAGAMGAPRSSSSSGSRSGASEAAEALALLGAAREAVDAGRHEQALDLYGRLVSEHPDLALAEYGRIGRAMMLYQVGRTSDSILALEDEEAALRGSAEIHAALAALLYAERPTLALRAEEEWNIACAFDTRYKDPDWVRSAKHWPPRMVAALQRFLTLS